MTEVSAGVSSDVEADASAANHVRSQDLVELGETRDASLTELGSSWAAESRGRSAYRVLSRKARSMRRAAVLVPAVILAVIVAACFLGPRLLSLPSPTTGRLQDYLLPVGSPHHLLGTNALGNDMLSQLLYGGQLSLIIGAGATLAGLVIGAVVGMTAGYYQGVVGGVLMRLLDVIFAFPDIILALAIAAYLTPSVTHTIWAIGFFSIAGFGRITRAQTIRMTNADFVLAARSNGASGWRIMRGHIWPNISGPVLTYALVGFGQAMMAEAALSFLGLGVPIPQPSWGNIISSGQDYMSVAPRLIVMPAMFLFATIVCVNLLSDAVRSR